jgi:hypothetical protein
VLGQSAAEQSSGMRLRPAAWTSCIVFSVNAKRDSRCKESLREAFMWPFPWDIEFFKAQVSFALPTRVALAGRFAMRMATEPHALRGITGNLWRKTTDAMRVGSVALIVCRDTTRVVSLAGSYDRAHVCFAQHDQGFSAQR